jgi:hypothetical protein
MWQDGCSSNLGIFNSPTVVVVIVVVVMNDKVRLTMEQVDCTWSGREGWHLGSSTARDVARCT